MIRVGIVGLGFMAAAHLRAYRKLPQGRVTALCSPSGRRLDGNFAGVSGNVGDQDPIQVDMKEVQAFTSFEQMLADGNIDVVDICTPTSSHVELTRAALRAGKHVLCEKPLARHAAEARSLRECERPGGPFFMPAMCLRFWPEWRWLREAIVSGEFGKVLGASFRRVAEPPAWGQSHFSKGETSGGALFDLHVHDTDFVQFCFGRPQAVFASGYSKHSGAVDHLVTQYLVAGGPMVFAEGSWSMNRGFGFNMAYTVNFERATADYDLSRAPNPLRLCRDGQSEFIHPPGGDGYLGELEYFLGCIAAGKAPELVTLADAISAVEICEAEERSVQSRQIVQL